MCMSHSKSCLQTIKVTLQYSLCGLIVCWAPVGPKDTESIDKMIDRQMQDQESAQASGLDAEENMGISSPLYQIIDVVFDLRARGFLRRQVCLSLCDTAALYPASACIVLPCCDLPQLV